MPKFIIFLAVLLFGANGILADVPKVNAVPNPASSVINIQVSSTDNNSIQLKLFTVLGTEVSNIDIREIDSKGGYSINVSPLQDGIYLLVVQSGKEQVTKRIKVQH